MTILQVLQSTGLPVAYSHFRTAQQPPFLVYIGNGQSNFSADNTFYHSANEYRIEYYFEKKNEQNEQAIETALLSNGYQYEKSEDTYITEQNLYVLYYYI